jgi:hypothetical protein
VRRTVATGRTSPALAICRDPLPERRQHQWPHFCRGATEGLNLVARGFQRDGLQPGDEVLVTEAEHYSNIIPWLLACREADARLRAVPVTQSAELERSRANSRATSARRWTPMASPCASANWRPSPC